MVRNRSPCRRPAEPAELEDLRTVGVATARWLRAVGITSVSELRWVGAPQAYGRIAYRFGKAVNRNLLYALAGALEDRPYNSFRDDEKRRLCQAAAIPFRLSMKAQTLALIVASGLAPVAVAQAQGIPPYAVAAQPELYRAAVAAARGFIRDTMRALGAPGAAVTVVKGDTVLWSEGFGYADAEQLVPVTALTRFRIGSVSKPLTSVALGLLVEQGKIDLDAPVRRYVPSFPEKRYPITVRQVAGHLSGIRHYRGTEDLSQRPYHTVLEGLKIFQDDSLLFAPGTRFSYSSYGWNLLSAAIEGASGQSFLSFMQHHVFEPAGMRHTVADHVDSIIPFRAHFYTVTEDGKGSVVNAPFVDNSYKWAGGGFLSTTEDLTRFGQLVLAGRLLEPATVRLLWTPQRTSNGKETRYGIGWEVDRDAAGRERVGHGGGSVGGTAFLLIYPRERLVIAVLVNSDRTFVGATPRIAEYFLGSP